MIATFLSIDPTSRRPGVGIKINLRSGPSSAAGGEIRILLMAAKNATGGTATVDTVLYQDVVDANEVAGLAGVGGMAHLAAARLFEEHPTATLDCVFMAAASGNTATGAITFDDGTPVTAAQTVIVNICGRIFSVVWEVGESDVDVATKLVSKIGQLTRSLPVTASNGGGTLAAVTITFKQKGKAGLDVRYGATLADGTGGDVTPNDLTNMTGGTTEPDNTAALLVLPTHEYRIILPCLSNADVATASATSNMGRLKAYMAANDSGIGALLQTAHTFCTDSTAHAKAMTGQHDWEYFSHHLARGGLSLPCEWAGATCGLYAREIKLDPAHSFIEAEFKESTTLYGSPNLNSDALSEAEEEDLLNNGASYIGYTAQRRPRLARPISTYFEDSDGNPDDRVLDFSKTFAMCAVGDDLRVLCQRTFKGKKLMKTLPSGRTPIPPNVVGEEDAKGIIIGRIRSKWVTDGVIRGDKLDEVIADGSLVIQVDPTDEMQLDAFLPLRVVPPLAKTSLYLAQA